MEFTEVMEKISRKKVLIGLIVLGILIMIIDIVAHNNKLDIHVNARFTQIMGMCGIIGGIFAAGFMSKQCRQ